MSKYQIRLYGTGLLVNAKEITSKKSSFWKTRKTTELTHYLFQGDSDFNDFKIPNYAKFEGVLAEDETDLNVQWSHDTSFSKTKIVSIYGPKIDAINRIECVDLSNNNIIWAEDSPKLESYVLPDDPDEEITAFLEISKNNLLIFESEKGCWIFECEYDFKSKIVNLDQLKVVLTNCSFGDDIDPIIDSVCIGLVASNMLFILTDADTETIATFATVYIDNT
jgi:hypothetical protein